MKEIEDAGYPSNAVEVEAFQLALPTLVPIERLIVSAQKRLDQYLKELEKSPNGASRHCAWRRPSPSMPTRPRASKKQAMVPKAAAPAVKKARHVRG
jgi:hypothetical protein